MTRPRTKLQVTSVAVTQCWKVILKKWDRKKWKFLTCSQALDHKLYVIQRHPNKETASKAKTIPVTCYFLLLTENSMFFLSWLTALSSGTGSVCLIMLMLSPVKMDWSIFRVVEWMAVMRMSAGILSPTEQQQEEKGKLQLKRMYPIRVGQTFYHWSFPIQISH